MIEHIERSEPLAGTGVFPQPSRPIVLRNNTQLVAGFYSGLEAWSRSRSRSRSLRKIMPSTHRTHRTVTVTVTVTDYVFRACPVWQRLEITCSLPPEVHTPPLRGQPLFTDRWTRLLRAQVYMQMSLGTIFKEVTGFPGTSKISLE
jgi:hypothetical protein